MIEPSTSTQCPKCGELEVQTKSVFAGSGENNLGGYVVKRCPSCGNSWQESVNRFVRTK